MTVRAYTTGASRNLTGGLPDHKAEEVWRPLPFWPVLAEARRRGRARTLVVWWILFTLVCCMTSVVTEAVHWAGIPVQIGPATVYLTLYLPIVLCTFALFWVGFSWACISAFLATFVGALFAGMPVGWAVLFACADPVWLSVYALAYRVTPLRVDMRSVASSAGFVALSLVAAFAGSTGSFIYSHHQGLSSNQSFAIWQGWWLGGFIQAVALNLPVLLVAGPAVERFRRRHLPPGRRPHTSLPWLLAAISTVSLALALFVLATGHQGLERLESLRQLVLPTAQQQLSEALWALHLLVWHSLFLVLLAGLGVVVLAIRWSRSLRSEVAARTTEIQSTQQRFELAAKATNDGLWDWDLVSGLMHFSDRWKDMLGYAEGELGDSVDAWKELVHPDEREQLDAALQAHIDGHTSTFEGEFRLRHKNGGYRLVMSRGVCVRDENGRVLRMAGSQTDVSETRAAEQQLVHDAFHDELTGLPNRALFVDRLSGAIARARRHSAYLYSVLFLDLDHFKIVNDTLGHGVGDLLLKGIAERLTACLRPVDTVSRFGGDEFAILLDNISTTQNATELADRIHQQLSRPFVLNGNEVFSSASIGIASSRSGYSSPEDVLRDADTAMYRAKSMGKARHQVFDTAMHAQTLRLLLLETDLRQALERDELMLHFQPVYALDRRRVVGGEALLRWVHPKWGMVPQHEFLPLAEETGLIVPIGEWVATQAAMELAAWSTALELEPDFNVGLNLSERQLAHPDLVTSLEGAVQKAGLATSRLRLEITERSLETNRQAAMQTIRAAHTSGFLIELEDFGSGVSSLSLLHSLPLDALKLDRSWVHGLDSEPAIRHMVAAVSDLARALDLEVVAEGVETAEQLEMLETFGCHRAQGYFFAGVLSSEDFARHLRENR